MSVEAIVVVLVAAIAHAALVTAQAALVASVPSRLVGREDDSASLRRFAADPQGAVLGLQTLTALSSVAIGAAVASSWWAIVVGAVVLIVSSIAVPLRSVPSPEGTVAALAPFVGPLLVFTAPLSRFVGWIAGRRRLSAAVDGAGFETIVDESREEGLIADADHEIITAVLQFERRRAHEVMVPVAHVVAVRRSDTVATVEAAIASSGHSRLLVLGENDDEVLGFVHAKDLMALPHARRERPIPFDVIRMALLAAPDAPLGDVLAAMRRARRHVVVISDPLLGTVGMVTMEDILEVIVGDIVDESDISRGSVRGD